jgi:predicted nicotinamide N-methyase
MENPAALFPYRYELRDGRNIFVDTDPSGQNLQGIGATVWDAALTLCKYIDGGGRQGQLSPPWKDKFVVELGAGTGVVGVVAAYCGARVVLTDQDFACGLLRHNAKKAATAEVKVRGKLSVATLGWGEAKQTSALQTVLVEKGCISGFPDVLVVSDCFVWPALHAPLIESILSLCGPDTELWIAYEERNKSKEGGFFTRIREEFDVTSVPFADMDETFRVSVVLVFCCFVCLNDCFISYVNAVIAVIISSTQDPKINIFICKLKQMPD